MEIGGKRIDILLNDGKGGGYVTREANGGNDEAPGLDEFLVKLQCRGPFVFWAAACLLSIEHGRCDVIIDGVEFCLVKCSKVGLVGKGIDAVGNVFVGACFAKVFHVPKFCGKIFAMDVSYGWGCSCLEFFSTKEMCAIKVTEERAMVAINDRALVKWEHAATLN